MQEQEPYKKPIVAIVGRPNVGKSTLFNRITRKWSSNVEDRPGITRDRIYGDCEIEGYPITLMDTGGLQIDNVSIVEQKMSEQAYKGIEEADFIVFVMDGIAGVTPWDREWIKKVRQIQTPKVFVANKLDHSSQDLKLNEFYELGVNPLIGISAEHRRGFSDLGESIIKGLNLDKYPAPYLQEDEKKESFVSELVEEGLLQDSINDLDLNDNELKNEDENEDAKPKDRLLSIAIIGRPNVGKSTLLNTLLREDRCIVDDAPGTTRDPIHSFVYYQDHEYKFIDTAGIRRRAKTKEKVETVSVMQALKVVDEADITLLMIDSVIGPTEQDAHVAGYAFEKSKAIILIANKWDEGIKKNSREEFESLLELKLNYLNYCPVIYVSAKTGKNMNSIFESIEFIRKQYDKTIKTSQLNDVFKKIVDHHPLPVYKGQQIKMYYATQVSSRPPTFMVFCNYPKNVHFSYKRYLINALREVFELENVPVRVLFRSR
ncbi:ribosome biogenesis GTPase Der [bacterium K02(2017)]|nr:ribosome biogenesis GTPase Der [bacterium K02(2017)]